MSQMRGNFFFGGWGVGGEWGLFVAPCLYMQKCKRAKHEKYSSESNDGTPINLVQGLIGLVLTKDPLSGHYCL